MSSSGAPAGSGVAAGAPSRVLSGDAERRRLTLSEGDVRSAAKAAPAKRVSMSMRTTTATDTAATALRFIAARVVIGETGLTVHLPNGQGRGITWSHVGRVVVRQLPPDPPWDSGILLDLVAYTEGRWEPVRVFPTTIVNYDALAGGASTSRLNNIRRFARHVRERHPGVAVDDETARFMDGDQAPARFVDMTQFVEYDAVYV